MLFGSQLANGEIVKNPFLNHRQSIVLAFKHIVRSCHISAFFGRIPPRKLHQTIQIAADDTCLRACCGASVQSMKFTFNHCTYVFREFFLCEYCMVVVKLCRFIHIIPKLFANRLNLLTQIELALNFIYLFTNTPIDFLLNVHNVQFVNERLIKPAKARMDVSRSKNLLPHFML